MAIKQDIQSLSPSGLVELFVLDTTSLAGGAVTRFHAGISGVQTNVWWQGNEYQALPIEATGFDVSSKGVLPRPQVKVANVGGLFSAAAAQFDDLIGCKLTRKRTFVKYLDAKNFGSQRYNLLSYSEEFNRSNWSKTGCTIIANDTSSPFGVVTADHISEDSSTGLHMVAQPIPDAAISTSYTWSVYAHAAERSRALISCGGSSLNGAGGSSADRPSIFNLTTGQWDLAAAENSPKAVNVGSGWWRLSITVVTGSGAATDLNPYVGPSSAGATGLTYTGTSAGGIIVWGAQLEQGAAATDYIYTAATPAWSASPNPDADPNQALPDDVWFVDRKVGENRYMVEWELASAFDLQGVMLPFRQVVQNSCQWVYRGAECGYTGGYMDKNDTPTGVAASDTCSKLYSSCKARFAYVGITVLPYGGFPGAKRDI